MSKIQDLIFIISNISHLLSILSPSCKTLSAKAQSKKINYYKPVYYFSMAKPSLCKYRVVYSWRNRQG